MTARTQRRAEERKRKKALKPMTVHPSNTIDPTKAMDFGKVSVVPLNASDAANSFPRNLEQNAYNLEPLPMPDRPKAKPSPAKIIANQQNAQHSSGPRTAEGKSASSRNRSTHGLTGDMFYLLTYESQAEYDALEAGFLAEYAPAALTETLLVRKMTQSWWLRQRAQLLSDMTIPEATGSNCIELLPLYMRYQAHHDRAFHKALAELLKLRAEQRRAEVARQKSETAEILFSQAAEYNRLRTHALRLKLKKLETATPKLAPASDIGFVSPPASRPPESTPADAGIHMQEAAA